MLFDIESDDHRIDKLSAKDIVSLIEKGDFPLHSIVYSYENNVWGPIHENEHISRVICVKLMKGAISFNNESLFHHWCLRDIVSPKGDFTLMEIVSKLQKRELTGDSMISHPQLGEWCPINQVPVLSARNLQVLFQFLELRSSFKLRENFRVKVQKNMIATKDEEKFHGICWSLSTQGLGFDTFEKTSFGVNDKIQLTLIDFINGSEAQFDCQVVSVSRKVNYDSIGVKFDEICELEEDILNSLVK